MVKADLTIHIMEDGTKLSTVERNVKGEKNTHSDASINYCYYVDDDDCSSNGMV